MISIGNDIVALKAINIARTKQVNFYSKIITPSEKALYDQLKDFLLPLENFVWLLWSVKESVFKYLRRIYPELVFSPSKINITQFIVPLRRVAPRFAGPETEGKGFNAADVYTGAVTFDQFTFYYKSFIYDELISTVVATEEYIENVYWGIKLIDDPEPEAQSKEVRAFLINRLNTISPGLNLQIDKKPAGYPVVLNGIAEMPVLLSFAHHDRYVAYSFFFY